MTSVIPVTWLPIVKSLAPYTTVPREAWIMLIPLAAAVVFRLLAEWQLRLTLAAIFQYAPEGSVIEVQKRGLGGSLRVQVGTRHGPSPAELQ